MAVERGEAITPYPDLYLSTLRSSGVRGLPGANEGIFVFHPTGLGTNTVGSYGPGLHLDGSAYRLRPYDVRGFCVKR